jgi:hypothetical protein
MPTARQLVVTGTAVAGTAATGVFLFRSLGAWAGIVPWSLSVALLALCAAASVALYRDRASTRIRLALALLVVSVLVTGAHASGHGLLPIDTWHSRIYTAVLSTLFASAGVGIVRRRPWSRWAVLAIGGGGTLCGIMNLAHLRAPEIAARLADAEPLPAWLGTWVWSHVLMTSACSAFLVLLSGRRMAEAFAVPETDPAAVWGAPHALVRAVKITFVAQLMASAMSLLYALAQPVVPATRISALALAAAFAIAAIATLARKTAGVLVLIATGLGFAAQAMATMSLAHGNAAPLGAYYAVFWGLAGVSSVACALVFARTVLTR